MYLPPEGNPSVQILSPVNGDTIRSSIVGIRVNVTNFRLAGITANRPNRNNEGHIQYYLDGSEKTTSSTSFVFSNVENGVHTITIELRNNDNTPLTPPVSTSVTFTVDRTPRQIEIPQVP